MARVKLKRYWDSTTRPVESSEGVEVGEIRFVGAVTVLLPIVIDDDLDLDSHLSCCFSSPLYVLNGVPPPLTPLNHLETDAARVAFALGSTIVPPPVQLVSMSPD